jgi:hypothetical protein
MLSPNGRYRMDFTAEGRLVLSCLEDKKNWKPKPPAKSSLNISYWEPERTVLWNPIVPKLKADGGVVTCLKLQAVDANFFVVCTKPDRTTYVLWGANDNGRGLGADAFKNLVTAAAVLKVNSAAVKAGQAAVKAGEGGIGVGMAVARAAIERGTEESKNGSYSYEKECHESAFWLGDDGNFQLLSKSGVVLWSSADRPSQLKGIT